MSSLPLNIVTAPGRNNFHWKPGTVTWEEIADWLNSPKSKKECGGYILGTLHETTTVHKKGKDPCTGYHRTRVAVDSRSGITLDADNVQAKFRDRMHGFMAGRAYLIHSTFSHMEEGKPRYRVIIPLAEPVSPEEYREAADEIMRQVGWEDFDHGSSEPERFMYKPSVQDGQKFFQEVHEGKWLDATEYVDLIGEAPEEADHVEEPAAPEIPVEPYDSMTPERRA